MHPVSTLIRFGFQGSVHTILRGSFSRLGWLTWLKVRKSVTFRGSYGKEGMNERQNQNKSVDSRIARTSKAGKDEQEGVFAICRFIGGFCRSSILDFGVLSTNWAMSSSFVAMSYTPLDKRCRKGKADRD